MKRNELHVVPTNEGWQISPPPDLNEDETFDTRSEAVMAAIQVAEIENLDVIVHADDGKIEEKLTNSPCQPGEEIEEKLTDSSGHLAA